MIAGIFLALVVGLFAYGMYRGESGSDPLSLTVPDEEVTVTNRTILGVPTKGYDRWVERS